MLSLSSLSKSLVVSLLCSMFHFAHTTEQLSFSGGGAFGAVEIGILKKIRETYPVDYDMYAGISAGGLNSGFLSHYKDINDGIIEAEKYILLFEIEMYMKFYQILDIHY